MKKSMFPFGEPLNVKQKRSMMGGTPRPPWETNPYDPGYDPIDFDPGYIFCQLQCPAGNWLFCGSGSNCQPDLTANTLTCNGVINYC
jgi:hypothetical protein